MQSLDSPLAFGTGMPYASPPHLPTDGDFPAAYFSAEASAAAQHATSLPERSIPSSPSLQRDHPAASSPFDFSRVSAAAIDTPFIWQAASMTLSSALESLRLQQMQHAETNSSARELLCDPVARVLDTLPLTLLGTFSIQCPANQHHIDIVHSGTTQHKCEAPQCNTPYDQGQGFQLSCPHKDCPCPQHIDNRVTQGAIFSRSCAACKRYM